MNNDPIIMQVSFEDGSVVIHWARDSNDPHFTDLHTTVISKEAQVLNADIGYYAKEILADATELIWAVLKARS